MAVRVLPISLLVEPAPAHELEVDLRDAVRYLQQAVILLDALLHGAHLAPWHVVLRRPACAP